MFKSKTFAWVAACAAGVSLAGVGCAVEPSGEADVVDSHESELRLTFTTIDVRRPNARAGLTLIRTPGEYRAFFGVAPPADLNFAREAVLHYSTGIKRTGGYAADILSIDLGFIPNRVVVHTRDTSPGPRCFVTQAFTNPQVAVRFVAPRWPLTVFERNERVIERCEEPPFCASVLCAPNTRCDEDLRQCVPLPRPEACNLPRDPGPCRGAFPRFYFEPSSGKCEPFTYGGCQGNKNNFETLAECESWCPPVDICTLPADPGTCKALMPMWTFDAAAGRCVMFNYGGCEGNANRFATEAECQRACAR